MTMFDGGGGSSSGDAGILLECVALFATIRQPRGGSGGAMSCRNVSSYGNSSSRREWISVARALLNSSAAAVPRADGKGQGRRSWLEERVKHLVLRVLEEGVGLDMQNPSAVTKDLPMVASPVPVISCMALYVVVVRVWSARIRRSGRKPPQDDSLPLRCLIIAHNLFLCGLSLFMGVGLVVSARRLGYSVWGNTYRGDETEMGILIYIFYMSKLYEFVDTVIMLFRRNLRQVTFLHVYHHASITFIWWILCYTSPGADAYFSAAFNSCIHVGMYLYYLLAATVARDERTRRKYLFWGKYLTMMQMVQFLSFISQSVYAMLKPENYTRGVPRMLFFYSMSLLACFGNFFVKKYRVTHKSEKVD